MIYLEDSPVSRFSSFEQDEQPYKERKRNHTNFSEFSDERSPSHSNHNIHIINKMNKLNRHNKNNKKLRNTSIDISPHINKPIQQNKCPHSSQHQKYQYNISQNTMFPSQLSRLEEENQLLRNINQKLYEKLTKITERNQILECNQKEYQQQSQKMEQLKQLYMKQKENMVMKLEKNNICEENRKKNKIENLLKEVTQMKETISMLKSQVNQYRKKNQDMEEGIQNILEENRKLRDIINKKQKQEKNQVDYERWEKEFIEMFVDMCMKICPQIQQDWDMKKKTQISWKVVKNMIQRGIVKGLKAPKIEKSQKNL